ncbi:hypothetical protein QUC31_008701 [Theobroma cacao]|nr:RWP-RK domain - like 3 [Theobroma cacao]
MEDPNSSVPNNNPNDMYPDGIFNFLDFENLVEDLTTQDISVLSTFSIHDPSSEEIANDTIDPLDDPVIRDFYNERNAGTSQAGFFGLSGVMNNPTEKNMGTESLNFENSMPLSVWPIEPVPFGCSCCQVLREIVHTNGINVTKLEIHGRLGIICHAILTDRSGSTNAVAPDHQYQMFDFCKKSIEYVKQFLSQYCFHRSQTGYVIVQDPLSGFYEALCVGFLWDENFNNGDFMQPSSSHAGGFRMDQAGNSNNQGKHPKPSLSIQRERTRNLTLKDIEKYFHLPIEEAARRLDLSVTVLKKICRKYGVLRWPHRKIQSMEKQIVFWTGKLNSNDPEERDRAAKIILKLQRGIAKIREGAR